MSASSISALDRFAVTWAISSVVIPAPLSETVKRIRSPSRTALTAALFRWRDYWKNHVRYNSPPPAEEGALAYNNPLPFHPLHTGPNAPSNLRIKRDRYSLIYFSSSVTRTSFFIIVKGIAEQSAQGNHNSIGYRHFDRQSQSAAAAGYSSENGD